MQDTTRTARLEVRVPTPRGDAMFRIDRHLGRVLLIAIILAAAGAAPVARAQDDEPEENPQGPLQPQVDPMLYERQLESWVFANFGGARAARSRLESTLSQRVEDVERACGLSAAQKKKLEVAGRGEIKRFFDRVEETRRKIRNLQGPWDNVRVNAIWHEAQPLQQALAVTWFDEQSLFCKALHHTLSAEQTSRYEQEIRDRAVFHYRATISWAAVMLAWNLGWSDDQRQRFEKLLIEETRAPKKFHPHEYNVLMYLASRIPEAKIKPIFDELQWRLLRPQLMQAKNLENWLKNGGFVPGERHSQVGPAVLGSSDSSAS
jgi:hypothetical protein